MILFVGNLNKLATEKDLAGLLAPFGSIKKMRIMVDKITRRSRGYAYVDMEEETQALQTLSKLNSTAFMGASLIVGAASTRQLTAIDWS